MSPTRDEIQKLKSVRDDLLSTFRGMDRSRIEWESALRKFPTDRIIGNNLRRIRPKIPKLAAQIAAINNVIEYLENQNQ